jgi:hypothetical protein
MKRHLPEMHWMKHSHEHAMHLHPLHWIAGHPVVLALLIAGAIAAAIVGLAQMTNTGINIPDHSPGIPTMYPYGAAAY